MPLIEIIHSSKKKDDKRLKHIPSTLPQPVFRWVLLGASGSGKSMLIKNILLNKLFGYIKYFDEIYVFNGSLDDVEEMKELVEKHKLTEKIKVLNKFDNDKVQGLFDDIEAGIVTGKRNKMY